MRVNWLARALAVTGLSAVCAVAAHEGPAALGAGRPLLFALAGAALAALGVAALLASAVSRAGLILAGVAAHGGTPAPVALHVLFALASAAVVVGVERLLGSAGAILADAIATAVARLARRPPAAARPASSPLPAPRGRAHRGRAPPPAVAF
jgi:hypothetical protein